MPPPPRPIPDLPRPLVALALTIGLAFVGAARAAMPSPSGPTPAPAPAPDLATLASPNETAAATPVAPASNPPDRTGGKLLLTAGVSTIEGTAGGGLTPWALIGGYGSRGQVGAHVFATRVDVDDYHLDVHGVLVGIHDRIELSYARQRFDTEAVGAALGLGEGFAITQDIVGVKVRVLGDAVLDSDRWRPQVAIGVQHKRNDRGALLAAIGARDATGTDVYVSATKLFLARGLLVDATVRFTKANQAGILGFGGDRHDAYAPQLELSAAWLLRRNLAIGAEYRAKPDNLGIAREDDWWDVFIAWAPTRHVSVTVAGVDLGNVVVARQRGLYASVQVGF
jgi:hypothetical protein